MTLHPAPATAKATPVAVTATLVAAAAPPAATAAAPAAVAAMVSDNCSRGGSAVGDCAAEQPKGEAHRLQSWNNPVIFSYRTRDGNQNRAEKPASSFRTPPG